ncbi:unnamed protein product [Discosporangium mesarthrocarpum]
MTTTRGGQSRKTSFVLLIFLLCALHQQCQGFTPSLNVLPGGIHVVTDRKAAGRRAASPGNPAWIQTSRRTSSIEMVAPAELWDSYLASLDAAPLLTKSLTAGFIFPAADAAAQVLDKGDGGSTDSDAWDLNRSLRWLIFGFFVQAPWNHYFYVLLDGVLPPTPDPFTVTTGVKVVIDQFIQAPIFTVIIFAVLGFLEGKGVDDVKRQLGKDYKSTMLANWGVFVPAAVVNLAFCPPQLRVLFLNGVFFCWTVFLSTVLNKEEQGDKQG